MDASENELASSSMDAVDPEVLLISSHVSLRYSLAEVAVEVDGVSLENSC